MSENLQLSRAALNYPASGIRKMFDLAAQNPDAIKLTVPGSAFGACGKGFLRLVFANSDENLKEAVRRIDAYVRKAYPDMK